MKCPHCGAELQDARFVCIAWSRCELLEGVFCAETADGAAYYDIFLFYGQE